MIKPIRPSDIPVGRVKIPGVYEALKDFMETSAAAGEVWVPEGRTVKSTYQAYFNAIRRMGYPLTLMKRGDRLFVQRTKKAAPGAATPKGSN